jgi:hypothetical protein
MKSDKELADELDARDRLEEVLDCAIEKAKQVEAKRNG